MNTTVTCASRTSTNTSTAQFKKGTRYFKMPPGCSIHNDLFTMAGLPFDLASSSIHKATVFNIHQDILQGQSIHTLIKATEKFKEHGQKPPEVIKDLLAQYKNLPTLPVETAFRSTWNIFFMVIIAIIVAGALLFCYIRHVRGSTRRHKKYSRRAYGDIATMVMGEPVREEAFIPPRGTQVRWKVPAFRDITRAAGSAVNRVLNRHQDFAQPSPATRARRAFLAMRRPEPPPRPPTAEPPRIKSYKELLRQDATNEYLDLRQTRQNQYSTTGADEPAAQHTYNTPGPSSSAPPIAARTSSQRSRTEPTDEREKQ